jgi:hypothetical protein
MKNDADYLIFLMDMISSLPDNVEKTEVGEQEGGETTSTDTGGDKPDYPTVTKWESGVTRGAANQIGLTKWSDIVKITRGKANTLL